MDGTTGGADARPSAASGARFVIVLGALSAFGPLSMDMYLPALPSLTRDLAVSPSLAQLTLTSCLAGLALGQLLGGPVSDALGRRRPLLVGLVAYSVASLLCAVAPDLPLLLLARLLQGLAGAMGIVIARAVVRDLHGGVAAARFFAVLMRVNGAAPILAPVIGAQLLRVAPWRGVFVVLTVIGVVLLAAAAPWIPETLPAERRHRGGLGVTLRVFAGLLGDVRFTAYAMACGLAFGAMFAYIAGSPFVLQGIYGVSPQAFSACFAVNAAGIVAAGQVSGRLVGRVAPERLLRIGLTTSATGGVLLAAAVAAHAGLAAVLPSLFLVVASMGFVLPNATALALADHARTAGSASALVGVLQYAVGAAAAPLVGAGGAGTAVPMAAVIAVLTLSAVTVNVAVVPRRLEILTGG